MGNLLPLAFFLFRLSLRSNGKNRRRVGRHRQRDDDSNSQKSKSPPQHPYRTGAKGYPMWPCSRSHLSFAYSLEKANSPSGKR
jgi:hypothetical protein